MGPLHALRGRCEVVRDRIQMQAKSSTGEDEQRNCELLERAADAVTITTRMVADVADLARLDEGLSLRVKVDDVDLRTLGLDAIEGVRFDSLRMSRGDDGIYVTLDLVGAGGPESVRTDGAVVLRVLTHLLENVVREIGPCGHVNLRITSSDVRGILVEVINDGNGMPTGTCLDQGHVAGGKYRKSATIHRYAIDNSITNDSDELLRVRIQMEDKLRYMRQNGVGVGDV